MKGIKKTLAAGVLACTALHAHAEVSSLGYSIKGGMSTSSLWPNENVQFGTTPAASPWFNFPMFTGGAYIEYAFADYFGTELGVGYLKRGGTLKSGASQESNDATTPPAESITIGAHELFIPLSLCIYPMRRKEGKGILKLFVGPSLHIRMGDPVLEEKLAGADEAVKIVDKQNKNNKIKRVDFGLQFGWCYEFAFGLLIEGRGGIGFMNRFDNDNEDHGAIFSNTTIKDLKKLRFSHGSLSVGYNFASLFTD